ncbi:hypothetical protein Tco_0153956 [Tanacetum coccineum]
MKSVSLKQRLAGKKSLKKQWMQKEFVSKQGRKPAKAEPSVHKDPLFDELANDTLDYMDTENAQDMGMSRFVVHEEKEKEEKGISTDKEEVSTDRPDEGTDDQTKGRYDPQTPPTTTTPSIFGDDETIAQVLIIMSQNKEKLKEKEKGVELKDVEETERPRPTSTRSLLTLKPLPKIDPKDKGKKKIEEEDESDTESEGIPEAEKKFKQLARDEEMARKVKIDPKTREHENRRGRMNRKVNLMARSVHLYDLMREQYLEVTLDGFALILWGDLKIMMESSTEGNEQNDFWIFCNMWSTMIG